MLWTQIAERIGIPSPIMEQLLNCEKTFDREAFRADIARLSDPLCAEAAYRALAEKLQPDEGTVKIELCELMASELMWDKYAALGIDERVFFDTMAAFTRFINETRVYSGAWAIDRTWWSYRQSGMLIFRIGALEYELKLLPRSGFNHV